MVDNNDKKRGRGRVIIILNINKNINNCVVETFQLIHNVFIENWQEGFFQQTRQMLKLFTMSANRNIKIVNKQQIFIRKQYKAH